MLLLPEEIPKERQTYLLCISSSTSRSDLEKRSIIHACRVPLISGYYLGVGDLFSTLTLAHFDPDGGLPLPDAVGNALMKRTQL